MCRLGRKQYPARGHAVTTDVGVAGNERPLPPADNAQLPPEPQPVQDESDNEQGLHGCRPPGNLGCGAGADSRQRQDAAGDSRSAATHDAGAVGRDVPDRSRQDRWTEWAPFSYPFNLTRQPAANLPCGFSEDGLPVGLQVVGPLYGDALVLRACHAFECARPFVYPDPVV